jgi:hypothetical protein
LIIAIALCSLQRDVFFDSVVSYRAPVYDAHRYTEESDLEEPICSKIILNIKAGAQKGFVGLLESLGNFIYTIEIEVCTSFFQGCDIDVDLRRQALWTI